MGKIYDLIKSASYHAWDGAAIRKMAKAIDEGGAGEYFDARNAEEITIAGSQYHASKVMTYEEACKVKGFIIEDENNLVFTFDFIGHTSFVEKDDGSYAYFYVVSPKSNYAEGSIISLFFVKEYKGQEINRFVVGFIG